MLITTGCRGVCAALDNQNRSALVTRRPQLGRGGFLFLGAAMQLDFEKMNGLLPAIVQDANTGQVLMAGYMNREALRETLATGQVTFFSRSRHTLWRKGESSGHTLHLVEALVDCDADTVLVRVEAAGPGVCHQGYRSCFYRRLTSDEQAVVIAERAFDPAAVYGGSR
jgi:phosphoribosyl-AMP cyclohydrolase